MIQSVKQVICEDKKKRETCDGEGVGGGVHFAKIESLEDTEEALRRWDERRIKKEFISNEIKKRNKIKNKIK